MIDIKKIMRWMNLKQVGFSTHTGVDQGGISRMLNGGMPSLKLQERIIEKCTPTVLFINHSDYAPMIANAMLQFGQIDILEHEPVAFNSALKRGGLSIGVITSDKAPFLAIIEQAVIDSGLLIPWRGLKFTESEWREWND